MLMFVLQSSQPVIIELRILRIPRIVLGDWFLDSVLLVLVLFSFSLFFSSVPIVALVMEESCWPLKLFSITLCLSWRKVHSSHDCSTFTLLRWHTTCRGSIL
jgi:hypothetical protein